MFHNYNELQDWMSVIDEAIIQGTLYSTLREVIVQSCTSKGRGELFEERLSLKNIRNFGSLLIC